MGGYLPGLGPTFERGLIYGFNFPGNGRKHYGASVGNVILRYARGSLARIVARNGEHMRLTCTPGRADCRCFVSGRNKVARAMLSASVT